MYDTDARDTRNNIIELVKSTQISTTANMEEKLIYPLQKVHK